MNFCDLDKDGDGIGDRVAHRWQLCWITLVLVEDARLMMETKYLDADEAEGCTLLS